MDFTKYANSRYKSQSMSVKGSPVEFDYAEFGFAHISHKYI